MMTKDEFVGQLVEAVYVLEPDAEIRKEEVVKQNDVVLTGIVIGQGDGAVPIIYDDGPYEQYLFGRSVESIAAKCVESIDQAGIPDADFTFPDIREKVRIKLLSTEANARYLADKPHREILDLSVAYYYELDESASAMVTNAMAERIGITERELFNSAVRNLSKDDLSLTPMGSVLGFSEEGPVPMYVLMAEGRYGARALLDPRTEDLILKAFKGQDCIIIPSSVHELIMVPKNGMTEDTDIAGIIEAVNLNEVDEQEVLSFSVYGYSPKRPEGERVYIEEKRPFLRKEEEKREELGLCI